MRLTIDLPDALVEAARAKATAEARTFASIVEEGLTAVLALPAPSAERVTLPAYGDPGARFLVNPRDQDRVWDVLDADGSP